MIIDDQFDDEMITTYITSVQLAVGHRVIKSLQWSC